MSKKGLSLEDKKTKSKLLSRYNIPYMFDRALLIASLFPVLEIFHETVSCIRPLVNLKLSPYRIVHGTILLRLRRKTFIS